MTSMRSTNTFDVAPTPGRNGICPVCASPNGCVPAACGTFDGACWCASVTIDAAALARVPDGDRGAACLCAACCSPWAWASSR
jgi:Cysteine-rich CWC